MSFAFKFILAMAYYDDLEKPLKKIFKAKGISEAEIAKLAIHTAQKLKTLHIFEDSHLPYEAGARA